MDSIPKSTWKLKRFGRFLLETKELCSNPWKVFESSASTGELMLTLVESGHMLVSRGQELLGESRLMRMQFDGNSRPAAMEECASAVIRLKKYFPVITEAGTTGDVLAMTAESEDIPGCLSIKHLAQHFLGQHNLSLPLVYSNCVLPQGELEPFLRVCLLDPSFPALVEEVERELKKAFKN
ncbi:meiotic recombination protein REC114 [Aplochiton taeniatus]